MRENEGGSESCLCLFGIINAFRCCNVLRQMVKQILQVLLLVDIATCGPLNSGPRQVHQMERDKSGGMLGRILRKSIADCGLKLSELSKRARVDRGLLSRFVRGERVLSMSSASAVADVLGLQLVYSSNRNAAPSRSATSGTMRPSLVSAAEEGLQRDVGQVVNRFISLNREFLNSVVLWFEKRAPKYCPQCESYCAAYMHAVAKSLASVIDLNDLLQARNESKAHGKRLKAALESLVPDSSRDIAKIFAELDSSERRWFYEPRTAQKVEYSEDFRFDPQRAVWRWWAEKKGAGERETALSNE